MPRKLRAVQSVWVGEGLKRRKLGPGHEAEIEKEVSKEVLDDLIQRGAIIDEDANAAAVEERRKESIEADDATSSVNKASSKKLGEAKEQE